MLGNLLTILERRAMPRKSVVRVSKDLHWGTYRVSRTRIIRGELGSTLQARPKRPRQSQESLK